VTSRRAPLGVPLAWYLAITLAVPFLNGGYANEEFYEHAAAVLAVVAAVTAVVGACRVFGRFRRAGIAAKGSGQPAEARPGGS
jgi:hypothetical protein